jgi:pimeloyl-ACP methyl ester carboxylesterase
MALLKQLPILLLLLFLSNACTFNKMFYATEYKKDAVFSESSYEYEEIFLDTKNKKKIHCAQFKTNTDTVKGQIVYFHGNAGPIATWQKIGEIFARHGYNCLLVDYQGYGQSTGKATHQNHLESGRTAAAYVKKEQLGIPLILYGFSIGGHLSVKIAAENQDVFDLLIMEAAFSSHKEIAVESVGKGLKGFARFLISNHYKGSKFIKKITIPKLIIHSTDDQTAPYWMGETYYKNAVEKKVLWKINGPHGGALKYHKELIKRVETILQ